MTTPVWIGLGSNLGDRKAILDAAVAALDDAPGVAVRAVSSYHETLPVGGPPDQGPFLNAAARLDTSLDPHQLLAVLQEIEDRAGRVRKVRWGERTLDLDILIYGCKFLDTPELRLPHPRLAFRRFVLAPLAEIAPTIVDTVSKRTIAGLLANLDRRPRLVALEGPPGPRKATVFRRLVDALNGFGVEWGDLSANLALFENPVLGFSDFFERKIEALRVDRWAADPSQAPWFVADFLLAGEINRYANSHFWWTKVCPGATKADFWAARPVLGRIREAARETLEPSFAVVLTERSESRRRPGMMGTPLLWPDSTGPDAIVDEVLATCRAIEGV
jgi:2-amino-4-hydroxy-6-hydroxymethyldihydropteridine diphosphokinase